MREPPNVCYEGASYGSSQQYIRYIQSNVPYTQDLNRAHLRCKRITEIDPQDKAASYDSSQLYKRYIQSNVPHIRDLYSHICAVNALRK